MEITSALAFLVSGVSLALALVTVSLNIRTIRKTDLEILKLKHDLQEASSRVYVPTSDEITELIHSIKLSEQMSRTLYETAREHLTYFQNSNQQAIGSSANAASLEESIRSLEAKLSSVTALLEEWIYLKK